MAAQLRNPSCVQCCALLAALLAALLVLAPFGTDAFAESRPSYGKSLHAPLWEEPMVVDPLLARSDTDMQVVSLVFDTLYRVERGRVLPWLAAAMPDESSPLRVIVSLRSGVRFQNGAVLTAQDVIASLRRLRKSDLGYLLEDVQSMEVGAAKASVAAVPGDEVTGAEDGGASTPGGPAPAIESIVFHLLRPDSRLPRKLADLHTSITAGGSAPSWTHSRGTGPWRIAKRSNGKRSIEFVAFDRYWGGRSYLDMLVLAWHERANEQAKLFETGSAQISFRGAVAFVGHRPKYKSESIWVDTDALTFLGFGVGRELLQEDAFRRALSAAIDRRGMREIANSREIRPTINVLSARMTPRRFPLRPNPPLVRKLLTDLGRRYSQVHARTLELELIVNQSRPDDGLVARRVALSLFPFGIKVRVVALSGAKFARRARLGECDLYVGHLANSGSSPLASLRKSFVVGRRAGLAASLKKRGRSFIERIFSHKLPILPLFFRSFQVYYRGDLRGLRLSESRSLEFSEVFYSGSPTQN